MHISEGVLSAPVLFTGGAFAAAGTAIGLKSIDYDRIAQVGMLSSTFFVASLIHVNIGPSSVHLILNGIVGLLLGWASFPAILVALTLQSLFFQFGGITALGVNTVNMALPAILCYYLFGALIKKTQTIAIIASFAGGFLSVFFSAVLLGVSLIFTEENFWEVSMLIILSNVPVMIIEGIVTAFCIVFLKKVYPAIFLNMPKEFI
jgi:cobalt/nickel transport system permease protein